MIILVIPAYNEGPRIGNLISKAINYADKIIVVDDGSQDGTFEAAEKAGAANKLIVLRHKVNLGKGAALRTGYEAAVILGADVIVTIDGDGQHPPEYIPLMLDKMKKNNWQVIFSFRDGGDQMPIIRRYGNGLINLTARFLYNLKTRDLWCGMRAINVDILHLIESRNNDYSGEVQMALKVGQRKISYGEYPIPAVYDNKFRGVTIVNGLKLFLQMIVWRVKL